MNMLSSIQIPCFWNSICIMRMFIINVFLKFRAHNEHSYDQYHFRVSEILCSWWAFLSSIVFPCFWYSVLLMHIFIIHIISVFLEFGLHEKHFYYQSNFSVSEIPCSWCAFISSIAFPSFSNSVFMMSICIINIIIIIIIIVIVINIIIIIIRIYVFPFFRFLSHHIMSMTIIIIIIAFDMSLNWVWREFEVWCGGCVWCSAVWCDHQLITTS